MNCINCNNTINKKHQNCPKCGQKVNDLLNIRSLYRHTVSNYFSADSRIIKSIRPLVFRPGYLAKKFIEGKRLIYLHPSKFYLILSVLFFFLFSSTIKQYQQKTDILLEKKFNTSNSKKYYRVNSNWEVIHVFEKHMVDSLIAINAPKEQLLELFGIKKQDSRFKKNMYSQLLKIYTNRGSGLLKVFYSTISITLLILIPIFAVFLKLLFFKKGPLSHHLVFAFYFFSFLFLMFNIILITKLIITIPNWVYLLTLFITMAHLVVGIMKFYNKRFRVSFIKTGVLLISYFAIVLPISITVLGYITILLF